MRPAASHLVPSRHDLSRRRCGSTNGKIEKNGFNKIACPDPGRASLATESKDFCPRLRPYGLGYKWDNGRTSYATEVPGSRQRSVSVSALGSSVRANSNVPPKKSIFTKRARLGRCGRMDGARSTPTSEGLSWYLHLRGGWCKLYDRHRGLVSFGTSYLNKLFFFCSSLVYRDESFVPFGLQLANPPLEQQARPPSPAPSVVCSCAPSCAAVLRRIHACLPVRVRVQSPPIRHKLRACEVTPIFFTC